jgi:hypothetical protein
LKWKGITIVSAIIHNYHTNKLAIEYYQYIIYWRHGSLFSYQFEEILEYLCNLEYSFVLRRYSLQWQGLKFVSGIIHNFHRDKLATEYYK